MRLNKFLAQSTGISRREADTLIESGRVYVNGSPARIGQPVLETDTISFDGKVIQSNTSYIYLALNKPIGYVCSKAQQDAAPTIYSLLPPELQVLKTAGRLDKDSTGLVLLTNDGDFAHQLTHPRFKKEKIYEVTLNKILSEAHAQQINSGVTLDDGVSHLRIKPLISNKTYQVVMSEGRNRQIRRTFLALGYEVVSLHRTKMGNYAIGDIKEGEYVKVERRI